MPPIGMVYTQYMFEACVWTLTSPTAKYAEHERLRYGERQETRVQTVITGTALYAG
jgi:hypothetical protein